MTKATSLMLTSSGLYRVFNPLSGWAKYYYIVISCMVLLLLFIFCFVLRFCTSCDILIDLYYAPCQISAKIVIVYRVSSNERFVDRLDLVQFNFEKDFTFVLYVFSKWKLSIDYCQVPKGGRCRLPVIGCSRKCAINK